MPLIYDENPKRMSAGGFNPAKCNATKCFLSHFDNSLYLTFMLQHGTRIERRQTSNELVICERKQQYWARQPNFDSQSAEREIQKSKRRWL